MPSQQTGKRKTAMISRDKLTQRAERLHSVMTHAISDAQDDRLTEVDRLLDQTIRAAESLLAPSEYLDADQLKSYFPAPTSPPMTSDLRQGKRDWAGARARGRGYRETARDQVGPLLQPAQVIDRLGISSVTLSKWRRSDKILGLRFDDHQYLYPDWQFVTSPEQGERGILRHLDLVLAALNDCGDWTKAQFLLAPHPRLAGSSPLDCLADRPDQAALDRILSLARHIGETGQ